MSSEQTRAMETRVAAEREFAQHQITELSRNGVFRTWRCAKPGTGMYGFMITTIPGSLIVTGDIGELIVSRTYDMLPWARVAANDLNYFASKTSQNFRIREFSHQKFAEWKNDEFSRLRRDAEDNPGTEAEKYFERFRDGYQDFHSEEYGPDELLREFEGWYEEPPDWTDFTNGFLWAVEAVRWFVTHHSEPEVQCPAEPVSRTH